MSHLQYNFKKLAPVPTAADFLDIVLSRTQRKTPTVIRSALPIGRIRQFYMRKVRYTADTFEEKFKMILDEFPKIEDVHPFYGDLMNVLYDKDHYKLALGQVNTARHLVEQVNKDYLRLIKFGDSLYRCKQLKRAALGRMATVMKRQKDSLAYLEQVRQHLARLPSIDPNTRTLIVCGYPNVGKSSFMNKVTRADVDVQPYAFTTKSLFVGHMDYKYIRWQCIDTPGTLDHPLEQRNTIEMQSITALAHLRACIMFFMDLSESCGYSVRDQVNLFNSIKPLFANKPTMLVINKIDIMHPDQLNADDRALIDEITASGEVKLALTSCYSEEGVMAVRNTACDILLQARVEMKMKGNKINEVINKLNLTMPKPRDEKARPAFIPEGVKARVKYDPKDPMRRRLERDIEAENGGAGVFSADLKKRYQLNDDEWKYDVIPEIMEGKNVADFIDPEIDEKLEQLEREEERLAAEGFYNSEPEEMLDSEEEELRDTARRIRDVRALAVAAGRAKKGRNRPVLPLKATALRKSAFTMGSQLESMGLDATDAVSSATNAGRKRGRSASRGESIARSESQMPLEKRVRGLSIARSKSGLRDAKQVEVTQKMRNKSQRAANLFARRGESDREIQTKMPKHLFSGKRGMGSNDRR